MTSEITPDSSLNAIERGVARLWSEVLQTTELPGPTDDFFLAGGDSMAMVLLESRIAEEFSVDLPAGVILGAPTLGELSAIVDLELSGLLDSGSTTEAPSVAR